MAKSRSKKAAPPAAAKTPQIIDVSGQHETEAPPVIDAFKTDQLSQIEALAGLGLTVPEIGAVMGVSKATMERRIKAHPEIAEARRRGKAVAKMNVSKKAYEMAIKGNHHMVKFWLTTQGGFKETSALEVTGKDGAPIEVTPVSHAERMARLREIDMAIDMTDDGEEDE